MHQQKKRDTRILSKKRAGDNISCEKYYTKICNLPTLTLPPGPEALDISHGLLWEQMVIDKNEQGSQGFWSFGVNHVDSQVCGCVCVSNKYFGASVT